MMSACRGRSRIITVTSLDRHPPGQRDVPDVVLDRRRDVDRAAAFAAGDDLLHVDARARVEHRAAAGDRDDRQRIGLALRHQARAVDRVDGHVDLGPVARADMLAVVEHRRLVLLPLADDDHAVHRHRVEEQPHGVDGRPGRRRSCRPGPPNAPRPARRPRWCAPGSRPGHGRASARAVAVRPSSRPRGPGPGSRSPPADSLAMIDMVSPRVRSVRAARGCATRGTRPARPRIRGRGIPSPACSCCRRRPPRR